MSPPLHRVRARLAEWARGAGLAGEQVDDVVLATYEALANVADHAYPDGTGEAWLDARRVRRGIVVTVGDHGRWRPPPADPGVRGRGLKMITTLAQRVTVGTSPTGTTVTMRWSVGQSRRHDPAPGPRPGRGRLPGTET